MQKLSKPDLSKDFPLNVLIQNNLRETIIYMMQAGKYELRNFGEITVAYSDTPGPDYNMIFSYMAQNPELSDLQQAFDYAQKQRHQFLLVIDSKAPGREFEDLVREFGFKKIGIATKVAIKHNDLGRKDDSLVSVRRVNNSDMFETYCDIIDRAYSRAPKSTFAFLNSMNVLRENSPLQLYLGYVMASDQYQPVGTAMLFLPPNKQNLAGHYAWAVEQQYRGKGIMTSMVKTLIDIAKDQGYDASVAQCFDSSINLAKKIGFETYDALQLYVNS